MLNTEQIELLKKELPDWPCKGCHSQWSGYKCGECKAKANYNNAVLPYKAAGVMEYAEILKEIMIEEREIAKHQKELKRLEAELPQDLLAIRVNNSCETLVTKSAEKMDAFSSAEGCGIGIGRPAEWR